MGKRTMYIRTRERAVSKAILTRPSTFLLRIDLYLQLELGKPAKEKPLRLGRGKMLSHSLFHPDYTVGTGIEPVRRGQAPFADSSAYGMPHYRRCGIAPPPEAGYKYTPISWNMQGIEDTLLK